MPRPAHFVLDAVHRSFDAEAPEIGAAAVFGVSGYERSKIVLTPNREPADRRSRHSGGRAGSWCCSPAGCSPHPARRRRRYRRSSPTKKRLQSETSTRRVSVGHRGRARSEEPDLTVISRSRWFLFLSISRIRPPQRASHRPSHRPPHRPPHGAKPRRPVGSPRARNVTFSRPPPVAGARRSTPSRPRRTGRAASRLPRPSQRYTALVARPWPLTPA